jgi:hypothetical protein
MPSNTGWQKGKLVAGAVDHKGMAGIVPALETHDHVGTLGEPVDNLALAFITPLRSDHHDIRHFRFPVSLAPVMRCLQTRASILFCFLESDPV